MEMSWEDDGISQLINFHETHWSWYYLSSEIIEIWTKRRRKLEVAVKLWKPIVVWCCWSNVAMTLYVTRASW